MNLKGPFGNGVGNGNGNYGGMSEQIQIETGLRERKQLKQHQGSIVSTYCYYLLGSFNLFVIDWEIK